jgi:glucose/mannose-6-phosphate isomerase
VPDSLGFLDAVGGLPEQLADAHRSARDALDGVPLPSPHDIDNVAVLGMGGSGIAGDVLAAVANSTLPVPVVVLKQIRTPRFIGPRTLVFAVSYSGDTDETLQMAAGALDAGARVVAVSRGGELESMARARGAVHVPCPAGYLPRAALGALLAPLFVALERVGLLPDAGEWLDAAGRQLATRREKCRPEVDAPANPAREVARRIGTTIPIVYGGGALGAVAAQRW